jgi:hypothetical protein
MTQTNADVRKEQQPRKPAPIESLPVEVLVTILSAAPSASDLHALIRASPIVYQTFLSAKRTVLVSIVAAELGPALRDAVAACLIAPAAQASIAECERVVKEYEALPRGGRGRASARGLSADAAVELVQANRSAQYLIDEFEASRRPELREVHADGAGPMTTSERRRFAAALFRHQTLSRIEHGYALPDEIALVDGFFALFRPWELHQLADANGFLADILSRVTPGPHLRPSGPENERRRQEASRDLGLLRRLVVAERARVAADRGVPFTVASAPWAVLRTEGMKLFPRLDFLIGGPLPGWTPRALRPFGPQAIRRELRRLKGHRDELYRREDVMPPLVPAEDDEEEAPPFAWVDGHDGLNCQRWGDQVRRKPLPEGQDLMTCAQSDWMQHNVGLWRWLGFPFWDRGRVQVLKTGMPVCETGWLTVTPPSDEECENFYRKVRMGDTFMPQRGYRRPTDTLTVGCPAVILGVRGNMGLRAARMYP